MKIGIYAQPLSNKLTGIGRYVYEFCKVLPDIFPDAEFYLISKNKIRFNPIKTKAKIITEHNKILESFPSPLWFRYFSARLINELNLDYIWCTLPITPLFLKNKTKKVVTVYDFNLYLVPNSMSFKTWVVYKLFFDKSINEADKIITISQGTAEKLKNFFGKNADAIIRPAVDINLFRKVDRKPYDFKYILSVSTIEPRKNIGTLIRAYVSLKEEGYLKDIKLVLVGSSGWKNKSIMDLVEKHKGEIIYTGYIPDEKLVEFYNGAEVFVFPSIYEGFGIPVLEARSCGCCVITTDIPELREACGDGCIYVKPDLDSLKIALKEFFYENKKCNYKEPHIITWEEEAKKFKEVFI